MQALPDPGCLPVAQPSPARHAAAAAHRLRQVFPADAGLEDKQDTGQDFTVINALATRGSVLILLGYNIEEARD